MRILIHPDNRELFEHAFGKRKPPGPFKYIGLSSPSLSIEGIPVHFTVGVPARSTREIWHPPKAERFVSYGPEDEVWARPLGLGAVELVDDGPCYFVMNSEPEWEARVSMFPPLGLSLCYR